MPSITRGTNSESLEFLKSLLRGICVCRSCVRQACVCVCVCVLVCLYCVCVCVFVRVYWFLGR